MRLTASGDENAYPEFFLFDSIGLINAPNRKNASVFDFLRFSLVFGYLITQEEQIFR